MVRILFVIVGVAVASTASYAGPPNPNFIYYRATALFGPAGEVVTSTLYKEACAGTLPPAAVFPAPPIVPCVADGRRLKATIPFSAQNPPTFIPANVSSTMNVDANLAGLTVNIAGAASGELVLAGESVEAFLYQPDIPAVAGATVQLKIRIDSRLSFSSFWLDVDLRSDQNSQVLAFGPPNLPPNGVFTTPALTIGPSGKYSIALTLNAGANQSGSLSRVPVSNSSAYVKVTIGKYVALGDSYSSGAGDLPYGASPEDQMCRRSVNNFPAQLDRPYLVFPACSGTTIDTLPPQLNRLDEATDLVTITVGGNDACFAQVVSFCAQQGGPCGAQTFPAQTTGCVNSGGKTLGQVFNDKITGLGPRLVNVYQDIRTRAPHARILALTYPNPFPFKLFVPFCPQSAQVLYAANAEYLSRLAISLNAAVMVAAMQAGVEFVDLNFDAHSQFPQHTLCDASSWFLDPIAAAFMGQIPASFHPNNTGEIEMARIIKAALDGSSGQTTPVQIGQQQSSESGPVTVAGGQGSMTVSSTWAGSDIVMSLISPSGRIISRSTVDPLVRHIAGPTFEAYTVMLPEAGNWRLRFYGADVPPGGEQVDWRAVVAPRAPGDADFDGVATCADASVVRAAFGKRASQPGFDPRADMNNDGVIDVRDLSEVSRNLFAGVTCR